MTAPHSPPIIGLILAGGSGVRLGTVRKSDIRLANRPLLAHLVARLAPQCGTIVLSSSAPALPHPGISVSLPDRADGPRGPAAGLYAGARWIDRNAAPGALMLSAAVDTPFFPADFAARSLPLLEAGADCVIGTYGGTLHPTCGLWRVRPVLDRLETAGTLSRGPALREILADLDTRLLDYADAAPHDPFANINTVSDLLACQRSFPHLQGP